MAQMGEYMNLMDLKNSLLPGDSAIATVAEMLNQENEILPDVPWQAGNLLTGDVHYKRTALPSAQIRKINQGFDASTSKKEAVTDTCVEIVSRMIVDMRELDLAPSAEHYLLNESRPHMEAMSEDVVTSLFYGADPEGIRGLAPRLGKTNHKQVVDFGGSGNNLASVYIVKWDSSEVTGIFPRNSKGGLSTLIRENELVPDRDGKMFRAHVTDYSWMVGFKVRDERYIARLCNIDRDALLGDGDTAKEARQRLFNKLIETKNRIHHVDRGRVSMYADPTVFTILEIAAFEKANLALGYSDVEGDRRVLKFSGIPIKKNDAQSAAEKAVA